jgi:hypothetical protein
MSEREELANKLESMSDVDLVLAFEDARLNQHDASGDDMMQHIQEAASYRLEIFRRLNLSQPPAQAQVTGEMVRIAVQTYSRCKAFPDRMSDDDAMQTALCAALQAGVPAQVTPMMVGNAIATYHATDGDWWKVCAEILSASAPAPGEGR